MLGVCHGSRTSHFQGPSRTSKRTAYAAPRQTNRPPQPSAYKIHAYTWSGLILTHRPSYISHHAAPLITTQSVRTSFCIHYVREKGAAEPKPAWAQRLGGIQAADRKIICRSMGAGTRAVKLRAWCVRWAWCWQWLGSARQVVCVR